MKKDLVLSLDLSGPVGTFAIHRGTELIVSEILFPLGSHLESFLPTLEKTFSTYQLSISDFSYFVLPSEPGSFTGLRLATSFIKAFSFVGGAKVISLSGAEARAIAYLERKRTESPLWIVTQSTSTKVIAHRFSGVIDPPLVFEREEFRNVLKAKPGLCLLDDQVPESFIGENSFDRFPLRARMLWEAVSRAETQQKWNSSQISRLTPRYTTFSAEKTRPQTRIET